MSARFVHVMGCAHGSVFGGPCGEGGTPAGPVPVDQPCTVCLLCLVAEAAGSIPQTGAIMATTITMSARTVRHHVDPFRAAAIARESLFDHLHDIKPRLFARLGG